MRTIEVTVYSAVQLTERVDRVVLAIENIFPVLNTPKLRQVFLEELESYKDNNITTLMAYGIK